MEEFTRYNNEWKLVYRKGKNKLLAEYFVPNTHQLSCMKRNRLAETRKIESPKTQLYKISSTERDVNVRIGKAWKGINRS